MTTTSKTTTSGVTVVHTHRKKGGGAEETFAVGSLFASKFSADSESISVQVHPNTSLTLNVVSREPSSSKPEVASIIALWYKQPTQEQWLCFLPLGVDQLVERGLDLTIQGPSVLQFQVRLTPDARSRRELNVFGTIRGDSNGQVEQQTKQLASTSTAVVETAPATKHPGANGQNASVSKQPKAAEPAKERKKRKASDVDQDEKKTNGGSSNGEQVSDSSPKGGDNDKKESGGDGDDAPVQQPLSKKQRRKLAQQKAKELADALSKTKEPPAKATTEKAATTAPNGDGKSKQENGKTASPAKADTKPAASNNKATPVPLTKPRRLPGGILVQDFLIGNGIPVKTGRNVSILYEGRFPNGKVFDRIKNRQQALVFRPGTGQVVAGLDQGMQGMKVGGKREITIPPELGYGKKGSPPVVPPNATLIFNVEVISAGGK